MKMLVNPCFVGHSVANTEKPVTTRIIGSFPFKSGNMLVITDLHVLPHNHAENQGVRTLVGHFSTYIGSRKILTYMTNIAKKWPNGP